MRNTKSYAAVLVLVIIATTFGFSIVISSLTDSVVINSTGKMQTSEYAASGSAKDIQAAVNWVASHGGTGNVYIPAGTFNFVEVGEPWKTVTVPAGVSIFGAGCLTTDFDETDQVNNWKTVLVMPYDVPSSITSHKVWFRVNGNEEPNKPTRISGFAMVGYRYFNNSAINLYEGIRFESAIDFRADHLLLQDIAGNGITMMNDELPNVLGRGVIDHCKLINSAGYPAPYETRTVGYGVYPRLSWSSQYWDDNRVELIGTYNRTLFVEDCYFQRWRHSIGSNQGAHYVFRYNRIKNDWGYGGGSVDAHGQEASENTATMVVEIYNNTITDPIMPRQYAQGAIGVRGGCGVVCNNVIDGYYYGIYLTYEALDDKYAMHNLYIWDNTITRATQPFAQSGLVENHNYFLRAPTQQQDGFIYTPYPYPHPLTLEA